MYNAALTTREREIGAHLDTWQCFTARMIEWLSETYPFLVFVMFGKEAQGYGKYINSNKHAILKTSHPAGRGYNHGFHDCDIFNEVNKILETNKREPIQWENYQYYTNTSPSS
jgi:uracil-DNA glycosylase